MQRLLDYSAPAELLRDKRILITGAADGIGRAVARSFADHGACLVLLDKKARGLETLYDEISAAGGPEPVLPDHPFPGEIDYAYYVEKVLRPVAEAILNPLGQSFDDALGRPKQLNLL